MSVAVDIAEGASGTIGRNGSPGAQKQFWWVDDTDGGLSLSFEIANDTPVLDAAFRLVHDRYVARRYMRPHPDGRRLSLYNALPTTKTFVATRRGHVVGTVTLIQDSVIGLPMDDAYRGELGGLRARNRRLSEVSALALTEDRRTSGLQVLMRLVRMLVLYAAEVAQLDELCIAVNPRHADFYGKAFYFRRFGELKEYQKVNGAPAVALRLDLELVRSWIAQVADSGSAGDDIYEFMFGVENYRRVMERIRRDLPRSIMTPEQFAWFFAGHESLRHAGEEELVYVQSFYADVPLERLQDDSIRALERSLGPFEPSLALSV